MNIKHTHTAQSRDNHQLSRTLQPRWVFALAVGSAVGWGAFVLPTDWLSVGGLSGTLIGFLVGSLLIGIIALSYGAVVRKLPVTGGGIAYAFASTGKIGAIAAGWCLTLGYSGIVALNASAIALVFRLIAPELVQTVPLYEVAGWTVYLPEVLISLVALTVFCVINIRGAGLSGKLQFVSVIVMLLGVLTIFASSVVTLVANGVPQLSSFPSNGSPLTAVTAIVAFAPWAYVGFDNVPQTASEFNFSGKKALALLLWGISTATAVYMAMTFSVAVGLEVSDTNMPANVAWPSAIAISSFSGKLGLVAIVVSVATGVVTGLNGFLMSTSRVLFTLGKTGILPRSFAKISERFGTPAFSIVFTACLCLPTPFLGRAALLWIVDMTSVGIAVAYFFTCFCAYRIGCGGTIPVIGHTAPASVRLRLIGISGCTVSVGFILLLLVPQSPGALSQPAMIALAFWLVCGLVFVLFRLPTLQKIPTSKISKAIFDDNVFV